MRRWEPRVKNAGASLPERVLERLADTEPTLDPHIREKEVLYFVICVFQQLGLEPAQCKHNPRSGYNIHWLYWKKSIYFKIMSTRQLIYYGRNLDSFNTN